MRNGELGVDIFFVISGFLMSTLLTRVLPLNTPKILDFYFRRIKRIVPMYLFIIGAFLYLAIRKLIHPLEYGTLMVETRPTLYFLANLNWKENDDLAANYIQWVILLFIVDIIVNMY
jgi:peptidoglycan/LPS O-acetylase OafA/YrhL